MAHIRTGGLFGKKKSLTVSGPGQWNKPLVIKPEIKAEATNPKVLPTKSTTIKKPETETENKTTIKKPETENKTTIKKPEIENKTTIKKNETENKKNRVRRVDQFNTAEIRSRVSQILGITNNNAWKVCDYDKENDLVLIDRNDKCDIYDPELRGIVIQLGKGIIIAGKYRPAIGVISNSIPAVDDSIILKDTNGTEHKIKTDEIAMIDVRAEGLLIHIFKYNGKIYVANNSNLNVLDAFGPNANRTFGDMFKETGVDVNKLFNPEKKHSLFVHSFIMVISDFQRVGNVVYQPHLLHVRTGEAKWTDEQSKDLETSPTKFEITERKLLTLEQANQWLKNGASTFDSTLVTKAAVFQQGESVHLTTKDGREFLINSQSWEYKNAVCHNLDMTNNFYDLIMKNNPIQPMSGINYVPLDRLRTIGIDNLFFWPDRIGSGGLKVRYPGGKFCYTMFASLLLSAPRVHKTKIIDIYERYLESRSRLVKWIAEFGQADRDIGARLVFDNEKSAYADLVGLVNGYAKDGGNISSYITSLYAVKQIRLFKLAFKYGPKL